MSADATFEALHRRFTWFSIFPSLHYSLALRSISINFSNLAFWLFNICTFLELGFGRCSNVKLGSFIAASPFKNFFLTESFNSFTSSGLKSTIEPPSKNSSLNRFVSSIVITLFWSGSLNLTLISPPSSDRIPKSISFPLM